MEVCIQESANTTEWDDYVSAHAEATIYHMSGWRRVISEVFGRTPYYLEARLDGRICGILPLIRLKSLLFGDFLVSMPYLNYGGMLVDSDEARTSLVAHCKLLVEQLGVRHAELRHTSNQLDLPARTDRVCMHLSLPESSDALLKQLGSKLRAQIKRPLREGAKSTTGGVELVGEFYRIFSLKYRQLGVPVYPQKWFESLLKEFPDNAAVHLVSINGAAVAASIVIDYRDSAEVVWAASVREADRLGANMFLYWSMLDSAIQRGRTIFDFGRTTEGSGTHRFKKQWGAQPVQLYWHYMLGTATEIPKLNLDNPKYQAASAIWRKLPLWAANAIGPTLVKNLP